MKRNFLVLLVVFALCVLPLTATAASFTNDRTTWEGVVIDYLDVDLSIFTSGQAVDAGTAVALPGSYGSVAFDTDLTAYEVGSGWATWSGGLTPMVLDSDAESVVGTFTPGVFNFGLEMEPNVFDGFIVTLALADGSSLFQNVEGESGASFFGFVSDVAITSIFMSTADTSGFAFGRMVVGGDSVAPVPEPGTLLLLGSGLVGLAFLKRRKK